MATEQPFAPHLEELLLLTFSQLRFFLQSSFLHSLLNAALQEGLSLSLALVQRDC